MRSFAYIACAALALTTSVSAAPVTARTLEDIEAALLIPRGDQVVSGDEVTGTTCTDTTAQLVTHDTNVAILSICGGIAGTIEKCGGAPTSTTGESGTSKFTLNAVDAGATINISKGRWERCIKAAQLTCPTGTFSSTCIGGASTGNVAFSLSQT